MHELGHTLGLKHTDQAVNAGGVNGSVVTGTPAPGQDPNSVMHSTSLPWTGFTQYDVKALQVMYPGARNRLYGGEELRQTQELRSANGQYRLTLQTDGNLVLYKNGTQALWSSRTSGKPQITRCAMQTDGNLVLYDANGQFYWASRTNGNITGKSLAMQDDGNLVMYDYYSNPVWATGTNGR